MANNLVLGNSLVFDHRTQEWAIFRSRFSQFCLANNITEETDKSGAKRRAVLLSVLVEDTYRITRDLIFPSELDKLSFQDLVSKLDDHFESKRCGFAERYLFYKAEQRPGEELSDWAARVRAWPNIVLTTELESALRDRFVLALENTKEKVKLFAEDPASLTFNKALQLAQSVRCARLALHSNSSGALGVGAVASADMFALRPAASVAKRPKCSVCGYHNHSKDQCKFTQYSCKKCGKKGHLSRVCKSKIKSTNFLAEDTDDICEGQKTKTMAPNVKDLNGSLSSETGVALGVGRTPGQQVNTPWVKEWHWPHVLLMLHLHSVVPFGVYLALCSATWQTITCNLIIHLMSMLGITAGAHRLFTHKSYKAKWPLRAMLVFFNTFSLQNSAITWVRYHRVHHKYVETDADPTNSNRGFFFAHIGWLFLQQHPEYERKAKGIDMSDLYADPLLHYQDKYYLILAPLASIILPTIVPVYLWNESWTNSYCVALFRIAASLHVTFLVNSVAHMWGSKPYDKDINPTESLLVSTFIIGEGFHNYHHTFPWDYKAAELGNNAFNFTTMFINFFAKIGWAYDLKTTSDELIQKHIATKGDGSRHVWGWGDWEQPKEQVNGAIRINPKDD